MNAIVKRMTGEKLLLARISGNQSVAPGIAAELERRARLGDTQRLRRDFHWAGRTFAARHSARLAA